MNTGTIMTICIIGFVIVTIIVLLLKLINKIKPIVDEAHKVTNLFSSMSDTLQNEMPTPKSVGGATNMYLKTIEKDFPKFHNPDAEAEVKTFIEEYIKIKYRNIENFEKSDINKNISFNISKETKSDITDICFNTIAIYDYKKTTDYATIIYRCSVGYNTSINKRIETRYEIEYTLQLFDKNIATDAIKCVNCGATLKSTDICCPYCGTKIIQDTILNWNITSVKEI